MAKSNIPPINIENARIMWLNFSGEEREFNSEGERNFCVAIEDPKLATKLAEDGWNVKIWIPKGEDLEEDERRPIQYLKVKVSYKYDYYAPKVVMVTRKNQVLLNEDTIGELDTAKITNADVTIVPSEWEVNGKTGIKAYLKTLYVTIEEDEWAAKYDRGAEDDIPFR